MRVLVPLAEGAEEMEAVIIVDVLRRAEWEVVMAGLSEGPITASRGVRLLPDVAWDAIDVFGFDMIVLPGGLGGTEVMSGDDRVLEAIRVFDADSDKWGAAVCAAPQVLQAAGVIGERFVTCHPGARANMQTGLLRDDRSQNAPR